MIVDYFTVKKCYSFKSEEKLNHSHTPLCANVENVLTIMPEKNKNDTVKFRDYHMQTMQPFMIIADFETYTDQLNQIKPYSFAMFSHCIFNESNNKLTHHTGEDCLDEFFNDLTYVNRINEIKQNLILVLILMSIKVMLKIQFV